MNLLIGIAILVVADAAAIAALLFVRRRAPEGSYFADGDRASGVFGVLATGFAILAGFVIFLAFTTYDDTRSGAEAEALAVMQQYETALFFPAEPQAELTGRLVCYGRHVVHQEWPEMERGGDGQTINPWAVALFETVRATQPRTATAQSAYDKWLDQTSDREAARRDRIHGAAGIIPTSVWIVLFLTGAVVFAYMLFFADSAEMARSQAMLIGSATTVLVATLLVIFALDKPYRSGVSSIEPVAMERSLDLIDQARTVLGDDSALPCDERGVARD
jgi:hypothetical protein